MRSKGPFAAAATVGAFAWLVTVGASAADPTKDDCISAINGGEDLHQAGELREARAQFAVCIANSCPAALREDCVHRLDDLVKSIPTLVFDVKDAAGNDLAAVRVTMDGKPFLDKLDGNSIEVDPGEHTFVFEADGQPKDEKTIVVKEGEKERHVPVVLGTPSASTSSAIAPAAAPPSSSDGRTQRTMGLVVGGAGVAGLVVGTVFGFVAKSTYDGASQTCRNGGACTDGDAQHSQDAHTQATASTVFFVAGAALAGGGAALYFTAPRGTTVGVAPSVGPRSAGMRFSVVW